MVGFDSRAVDADRHVAAQRRVPHVARKRLHLLAGERAQAGQRVRVIPGVVAELDVLKRRRALVRRDVAIEQVACASESRLRGALVNRSA